MKIYHWPDGVLVAGQHDDFPSTLMGREHDVIASSSPKRRADFMAGRGAARSALGVLGVPPSVILRGTQGQPLWPQGATGSIAHCESGVCAAATTTRAVTALGVDIEPDAALPDDAATLVLRPEEDADWARLIFCVKECVHKTINPIDGTWLEFDEVSIRVNNGGSFTVVPVSAEARRSLLPLALQGHWWRQDGCWLALLVARTPL